MSKPQPEITSTYEPSPEPYPAVPSNATAAASTIPDELPPRPHTTSRSGLRDFFTFKFLRSYSLRGLGTDTRKRWRRILMITTLLILTATAIADFILLFLIGLTTFGIVFLVIDVVFIWTTAWSLAVIGDSVGTKRACGLTFVSCICTFTDQFRKGIYVLSIHDNACLPA